jgi:hypothetical protein
MLLHSPFSNQSLSEEFVNLWEEANDAAMAYINDPQATDYIDFLKDMKATWRHNAAFS